MNAPLEHVSEPIKHAGDIGAVGVTVATVFAWLPEVASLLSVIWLVLRIVESIQNIRAKKAGRL